MKICIVDTFRDHLPSSGGHAIRVFSVASWLSNQGHSVVIIRPGEAQTTLVQGNAPNIVSVARSERLTKLTRSLQIHLFPRMRHLPDSLSMNAPQTLKILREYIKSADVVQLEDPTLLGPLLVSRLYGKRIIADTDGMSSQVIRETARGARLRIRVLLAYSIILICESLLFRLSSTVVTSTLDDKRTASSLYHINQNKIAVVPNPIDASIQTHNSASKASFRKSLGLSSDTPIAIFVGDLRVRHNAEAVNFIAKMLTHDEALRQRNVRILIVGQHDRVEEEWKTPNLILTGPVRDIAAYIGAADVCIAPLFSQPTGIKTKILTYLALGKTTVATPVALIGLDPSVRGFVTECTAENFPSVLLDRLTRDPDSTPNPTVASMVQSLYGIQAIGLTYCREVLKSPNSVPKIVGDPSELPDKLS